jgi:uncharacterized protein YecE (DUF72 family)
MQKLFLGTSGYNYREWKEKFYPPEIPQREWLSFYAKHFDTVEINNSFYVAVKKETYEKWYVQTPDNFQFVIKGHRYISQLKKLHEVEEATEKFFTAAGGLQSKLSAVLWQFPANFVFAGHEEEYFARLRSFLIMLPHRYRYAFEFRHASWFVPEVNELLKKYNACLVIAQSAKFPEIMIVNGTFAYIRFHGPGALYSSGYSDTALKIWTVKIKELLKAMDVYVYFNNDAGGYALQNIYTLQNFLKG